MRAGRTARGALAGRWMVGGMTLGMALWMGLALAAATAAVTGCGGQRSGPSPTAATRDHERLVAHERRVDQLARRMEAFRDGWTRSYADTWRTALEGAREAGPPAFRHRTAGEAFLVGLVLFGLGFLARLTLGGPRLRWRWRRRGATQDAQGREHPRRGGVAQDGWVAVLAALGNLIRRGLAGLVRVFVGPRAPRDGCCPEVLHARTAERLLAAAAQEAAALAALADEEGGGKQSESAHAADPQGGPAAVAARGRALAVALDGWRVEVRGVRRALEQARGRTGARALGDTLRDTARRADELRVALQRAQLRGERPDAAAWDGWERALRERPRLPKRASEPVPGTVFTWTNASLSLAPWAVVALGGWAAAGAVPAWVALLLAAASVGGWVWAGARLRAAGRDRLLPGAATPLARRLVAFVGVVGLAAALSAATSAESGLNLGLPPEVPDPASVPTPAPPVTALPRPRLFPAPAPLPRPSPAPPGATEAEARPGSAPTPHPAASPHAAEEVPNP